MGEPTRKRSPLRYAQEALSFFTHGAACREDTTIARHMVTVGALVSREWTYRTAEDIEELLTRDARPEDGPATRTRRPTRTLRSYGRHLGRAVEDSQRRSRVVHDRHNGATVHLTAP
ncbi:MAG: hypothetical protein R3B40_26050 [Polyangiales bacterium]